MAIGNFPPIKIREEYTCIAKVALTANKIVRLESITAAGDMMVDLPAAATNIPFGVTLEAQPTVNGKIRVCTDGDVYMTSSAAIATFMTRLAFDTAGKVAAAAPASGVNAQTCGFNMRAAGAGDVNILCRFQTGIMQGQ
jgi:hypothetical protein